MILNSPSKIARNFTSKKTAKVSITPTQPCQKRHIDAYRGGVSHGSHYTQWKQLENV